MSAPLFLPVPVHRQYWTVLLDSEILLLVKRDGIISKNNKCLYQP